MGKIVASMNMSLDGYCDHTLGIVTNELHDYYTELIKNAAALLYGRITYQLMESAWPALISKPSGNRSLDEFAMAMENVPKLVFSKTLKSLNWESATLAQSGLNEEVVKLKQQPGKDILVGSPSLIAQLSQSGLVDEYRICIHPVISGSGLVLFKGIEKEMGLRLIDTKTFRSGVVALHYKRLNKDERELNS